jgi:hypothetical protein
MDSAGLLRRLAAEQRREERAAVREFVDAAVSADEERFYNAMIAIDEGMPSVWSRCMRSVARVSYNGPPRTLYRGDSASNRRRRRYGSAWSGTMDMARRYASTGRWRTSDGGSVLLEAVAPLRRTVLSSQCRPIASSLKRRVYSFILTGQREPRDGHREMKFAQVKLACFLSR